MALGLLAGTEAELVLEALEELRSPPLDFLAAKSALRVAEGQPPRHAALAGRNAGPAELAEEDIDTVDEVASQPLVPGE